MTGDGRAHPPRQGRRPGPPGRAGGRGRARRGRQPSGQGPVSSQQRQEFAARHLPMLLGRVLGSAVCTLKYPDLDGVKLLTVQPLNKDLEPVGPRAGGRRYGARRPRRPGGVVRAREASLALTGRQVRAHRPGLRGRRRRAGRRSAAGFDFSSRPAAPATPKRTRLRPSKCGTACGLAAVARLAAHSF